MKIFEQYLPQGTGEPIVGGGSGGGGGGGGSSSSGGVSATGNKEVPCRTCTDFKTWAKEQRGMMSTKMNFGGPDDTKTATSVLEDKSTTSTLITTSTTTNRTINKTNGEKYGCPYDKDELGRSTWGFLHTLAAYYPEKPSTVVQKEMSSFINLLSKFYPCDVCSKDFQIEIKKEPVNTSSQEELSQWLCRMHNKVNVKLGKKEFNCANVNQRWRDGWLDGSCDA